jgi:hypothetical protein
MVARRVVSHTSTPGVSRTASRRATISVPSVDDNGTDVEILICAARTADSSGQGQLRPEPPGPRSVPERSPVRGSGQTLRVARVILCGRGARRSISCSGATPVNIGVSLGGAESFQKMTSLSHFPFDLAKDPATRRDALMPISERVGITREVLTSLTEATRSGQRHLMCRVLDILQVDIIRPTIRLTQPQVVVIMAAVTELQHEAARAAPDIALFCARAGIVIDILSIA